MTKGLLVASVMAMGLWIGAAPAIAAPAAATDAGARARLDDPALVARGKYLATIGDCRTCHTVRGGPAFAGGRELPTPFGTVPAPNITPDPETGIGKWTFDDFWSALHNGVAPGGKLLYPAFPFTSYTHVTRKDAYAIFAYLKSVPAVAKANASPDLRFPYDIRSGMLLWRSLHFKEGVYQPDAGKSAQWNRGAYLVQGLGHCNECHTTRGALGGTRPNQFLAGGMIPAQDWYAPSLSTKPGGGLAGWRREDIVQLIKTGQSSRGAVFGPMAEVVRRSTQHLTDADVQAIAVYLQSLPAPAASDGANVARASDYEAGSRLYAKQCEACHGSDGAGVEGVYPPLDANGAITGPTGANAIRSVLLGGFPPATAGNPRPYSMPPFASRLSDAEVAAVVNYVRQSWSNRAPGVQADDVQKYRFAPVY